MELLCFKLKGKLAHFRRYYANNTAFSFSIPPRTTIMGIIGAACGWPRDSYYEKFSVQHLHCGVRVISPLKKKFHRLNLLSIKNLGNITKNLSSDFRGKNGRTQIPFEVVSGLNLVKDEVVYQLFLQPTESGRETFEEIKKVLLSGRFIYNITLGTANFSATLFDVIVLEADRTRSDDFILMHSAIPTHLVKELQFKKSDQNAYNFIEEDLFPSDFIANNDRELAKMDRLLFSITPHPLRVKLESDFFHLKLPREDVNIQFMDI